MNALVTGGSRGIGEAMVLKLGEMWYNVFVNYVSEKSKKLCDNIIDILSKRYNVKGYAFRADVSNYKDCNKLVEAAVKQFNGKIDVLINNAGIACCNVPFTKIKYEEYTKVIETNLMGTFNMCHLVIPYMLKNKCGCIINISSIGGLMGVTGQVDYCASKAGIIGMTRGLALEFGGQNIRVNCICPGLIETDLLRSMKKDKLDAMAKTIPLGKIGKVEDVSNAMEYLVKNEYVTGQYISPNGGIFIP